MASQIYIYHERGGVRVPQVPGPSGQTLGAAVAVCYSEGTVLPVWNVLSLGHVLYSDTPNHKA